jgi:hypothetical protein
MPNTPLLIHIYETQKLAKAAEYLKIKKRREAFVKEAKSLSNASNVALSWVEEVESIKNSTVKQLKDTDQFVPGKMYLFDYPNPLWPEEPFDQKPIVICLGETGRDSNRLEAGFQGKFSRKYIYEPGYMIGININFIPEIAKPNFLQAWFDAFKPQLLQQFNSENGLNVKKQKALQFKYNDLFPLEKTFFFSYAIRMYSKPQIKKAYELTYENWHLASCIIPKYFKGTNLALVSEGYQQYIRNKRIKYS